MLFSAQIFAPKEVHVWALITRADVTRFLKDLMLLADVPVMFVKCQKRVENLSKLTFNGQN